MSIPENKTRITVVIEKETKNKLRTLAEKEHRKMSNLVSLIIEEYVKKHYENKNTDIT